jgi:hypothetical protein
MEAEKRAGESDSSGFLAGLQDEPEINARKLLQLK